MIYASPSIYINIYSDTKRPYFDSNNEKGLKKKNLCLNLFTFSLSNYKEKHMHRIYLYEYVLMDGQIRYTFLLLCSICVAWLVLRTRATKIIIIMIIIITRTSHLRSCRSTPLHTMQKTKKKKGEFSTFYLVFVVVVHVPFFLLDLVIAIVVAILFTHPFKR